MVIEMETSSPSALPIMAGPVTPKSNLERVVVASQPESCAPRIPGPKASSLALDSAFENFEKLTAATAQRVVRFWQVRQNQ